GRLNGTVSFADIMHDPIFRGNLTINDLSIKSDTVGNAVINVSNTTEDVYSATATLTGRGNDVRLEGKYYMRGNGASSYDMNMNIAALPMKTIEAFSDGAIRNASGNANGR